MNAANIESAVPPLTDWSDVNWQRLEKYVGKLQQRIFCAESQGKKRKVRDLQRLLLRSQAALLLSIKRVTQINRGKRTAGVDGYKVQTPRQRVKLYNEMRTKSFKLHKPKPALRTYIPKKNGKLRPLGIPVIKDRVWQNVAKLALEPQWEAKFEGTSYGFRPKRSIRDAIDAIYKKVNGQHNKKLWVFEGDFKGCFDNLNHSYILKQIENFPNNEVIKLWLKSGFIDNNVFHKTESGTPQGGIISPLLTNIALHGMEKEIGIRYKWSSRPKHPDGGYFETKSRYSLVRYADDFVILCESKEDGLSMYKKLQPYLKKRGLELAEDKTKVTHLSEGFDFLGFTVRKRWTEKFVTLKGEKQKVEYYKTVTTPSKETIKKAKKDIKEIFEKAKGSNVDKLIKDLNPVIRGKANVWKYVISTKEKSNMDFFMNYKIKKFLSHLHPKKNIGWIRKTYYRPDATGVSKDKWILTSPRNHYQQMIRFSWTGFEKYSVIKGNSSPFDPSLKEYFEKRDIQKFKSNNTASRQKLAKKQKYKCPLCGMSLTNTDEGLETHHRIPKVHGGNNEYKNLWLVHSSCHIEHHRVFPAKGPVPNEAQLKAHKKRLSNLR
ncbi:group II intron reverse transcriptase/maturase (plasmid) [Priestia aryabhattai]